MERKKVKSLRMNTGNIEAILKRINRKDCLSWKGSTMATWSNYLTTLGPIKLKHFVNGIDNLGTPTTFLTSLQCLTTDYTTQETLPNVLSEPPLVPLRAIPMCPVSGSQREGTSTSLCTSPARELQRARRLTFSFRADQSRQAQSPQPLLSGHTCQPFHRLCCSPLDSLQDLPTPLKWWCPEVLPAFQMRLHQR